MRRVYLDHTATTPLDQRVFEAMKPYFTERFGNASSIHAFGQQARAALDSARDTLAAFLGAQGGEVIFTGSGTEADNLALKGSAWKMRERGRTHIIVSAVEHHAILEPCRFLEGEGFSVTYLPVDDAGVVDPEVLRKALRPETGLVSIMHANNEVGSINDIASIAAAAHASGALVHTDAVQSFGKIPIHVGQLGVDLLSISAHKIYGPKGIGALYVRRGTPMERLLHGGGQERGMRAGTENVPLAVGFAHAAQLMISDLESERVRLRALRARLKATLEQRFPHLLFNGSQKHGLPHILNFSFPDEQGAIDGEALLFNLDLEGVAVTSGSACTSGSTDPSHVLLAMGRNERTARASLRFSLGRGTTEDDIDYAVDALGRVIRSMTSRGA